MKENYRSIQYKGETYKIALNLNVWQTIQKKYGSFQHWSDITTGPETDSETDSTFEPDIEAVIFGIREMINEGIDIDNEENKTDRPFMTDKQIGRLLTEVGLNNVLTVMEQTMIDASQTGEGNA